MNLVGAADSIPSLTADGGSNDGSMSPGYSVTAVDEAQWLPLTHTHTQTRTA